ncbi:uncharacterized protein LOC114971919 [Acropora millepora]|uniref:uncharacterized protein LOC114971919 n=1 Tax=Acropora millepora TaxID=45264 RepID=UPI001CF2EB9F|nr:uncharacterized protein LOC114971919 [Acropora millepora]
MSDRDEVMSLSDSVSNENSSDESSSDEMQVVGIVQPYADEPLAHTSDEDEDEEEDQDGLTPAVLRARFEDEVTVKDWCTCGECAKENLTGALEYRCCKEIVQIRQKLTFDGSIEHLKCITKHGDFSAMTNRTVLLQVGPLLRDKNGKGYRRRDGQTENQFLRAVAYRWLVRWSCGYMGWNNARPLPACVYHILRQTFYSEMTRGYQSGQQREQ